MGDRRAAARARGGVAAIFFLNGTSVACWVVRIPDVQRALALEAGPLGVALLGAALGALLAMTVAGRLVARHGSAAVSAAAAAAYGATLALPALAPGPGALLLALVGNGAANGLLNVAMNAQAARVEGAYGRPIMASFHALYSLGGLAGAAVGGSLAAAGVTPAWHLAAAGALLVALAAAARRVLLPEAPAHDSAGGATGGAVRLSPRGLLLGALAFAILFAEGAMADWSAVYLRDVAGAGPRAAAMGFAAFSVAMAAGRVVGDRMTARLGAAPLVGAGGALATAGIALALARPAPLAIAIGFGAVGAGMATAFPSTLTAAGRLPGVVTGRAIAAVAAIGYVGLLVGPPIIGAVAQATSMRGGLAAVGAACAATALLARALRPAEDA